MSNGRTDAGKKLAGRGESNTPKFIWYVLTQVLAENKTLYAVVWTLFVAGAVLQYSKLLQSCEDLLKVWKPMIDIISSIGAFTAPFVFVVIAIFPSFSDKFRIRLEETSPKTGGPKVQAMLNHFTFVLICSLGMMLIGYIGKYFIETGALACSEMNEVRAVILSSLVAVVLMLLFATIIELLRSVRTMYVMIVADYTK